jgi:hypothetical protein
MDWAIQRWATIRDTVVGNGGRGPNPGKSAVVPTKSILTAANMPIWRPSCSCAAKSAARMASNIATGALSRTHASPAGAWCSGTCCIGRSGCIKFGPAIRRRPARPAGDRRRASLTLSAYRPRPTGTRAQQHAELAEFECCIGCGRARPGRATRQRVFLVRGGLGVGVREHRERAPLASKSGPRRCALAVSGDVGFAGLVQARNATC